MKNLNSKLFEKNQVKNDELRNTFGGYDTWSAEQHNKDGSVTHEFCGDDGTLSYITVRPSKVEPISL